MMWNTYYNSSNVLLERHPGPADAEQNVAGETYYFGIKISIDLQHDSVCRSFVCRIIVQLKRR
jgi:hypothetical protein